MASHDRDQSSSHFHSSQNQSIPLQTLSSISSHENVRDEDQRGRRRTPSGSGHIPRRSLITGSSVNIYERIADESPDPTERAGLGISQPLRVVTSTAPLAHVSHADVDIGSPLDDITGFALATNSIGLSLGEISHRATQSISSLHQEENPYCIGPYHPPGERDSIPTSDDFFSPANEDRQPLTDSRYIQPISGTHDAAHGRTSMQSVRIGNQYGSRLGDDLNLEDGPGGARKGSWDGSRSRSISPSPSGNALIRAGSIMRMMSQRVVNLSNEPEVLEQTIQRGESLKQARLEAPPSLPAVVNPFDDGPEVAASPQEEKKAPTTAWRDHSNPLRGKALGIFAPDNRIRAWLLDVLVHPVTEPFILIVIVIQTILLTIQTAPSVFIHPRSTHWGNSTLDYLFFVIFLLYTIEIIARTIVSGFIFNPIEYSTLDRSLGFKAALAQRSRNLLAPHRQLSMKRPSAATSVEPGPSILRSFTSMQPSADLPGDHRQKQRVRLAHRAFLRHSFNRLDFLAVISYWISFGLSIIGYENSHHIYIFDMLSSLRLVRLLGITNGTSVILRSLKKAAPLLGRVGLLIGFFWLIFAIIGNQSFESSLRRTCVWVDPLGINNFTMNDPYNVLQFCGGYLDNSTGDSMPWLFANGLPSSSPPKGYLCPQGSLCVEGSNPYDGTVSFDNILNSLELVFVVMSTNTFTDLLYYLTDTDYMAAALFFAGGVLVLGLWMVNLLIAVITSSFHVIREESKRSAFAMEKLDYSPRDESPRKMSAVKRFYSKSKWFWLLLIAFDLIVQCFRSASMGAQRAAIINNTETVVTIILLVEMFLRFGSDWRYFYKSRLNWVDLFLAIITCIIQIPVIHNSGNIYAGLTIFQILRIYRIVLAFSLTRDLIMTVFRNTVGLVNLILFLFFMTFLASIFAAQLFRGQIPPQDDAGNTIHFSFFNIYNSFLAMYQVLSSENWTTIMYNSTVFTVEYHTAWISASFFILWFILANFIILNMFIAVIQESFDVSEDVKRLHQVRAFLQQKEHSSSTTGNLPLTSIFKLRRESGYYRDPLDHAPATLEMLLKGAVVEQFLDEQQTPNLSHRRTMTPLAERPGNGQDSFLSRMWVKLSKSLLRREPNPFHSRVKFSRYNDDVDPSSLAREVVQAAEERKRAQREYLAKHPLYNKSLYIFSPKNPIRKACQRIVGPGHGSHRAEGVEPYKPIWFTFSIFIYAVVIAMVLLACITTPLYQLDYFQNRPYTVQSWFNWADVAFAIIFTIEAMIKVIADGFFWAPNAYFRGSWGFIDGVVLITLWINVITAFFNTGSISRFVGAFKALRALRLLNVSDSARDTFHSVLIVGAWKVISAAFVSLSFLFPFAIYGLNLFNGRLLKCNNTSISGALDACIGEYGSSPYGWSVLAPQGVANPYFNFDNFGDALFILFQIVSQEGWIDVQWSTMSITGLGQQPAPYASPANALFFVAFNILGAVFVLTLFVSVFMRNYTEQTGVAFLTVEQRSWLELKKLLKQISPSKRSAHNDSERLKIRCYQIAKKKHGRWHQFITTLLVLHLVLLMLGFYPQVGWWEQTRRALFLLFTLFYLANLFIRIVGLGWRRFRRSWWDLFSLVVIPGALTTTILAFIFGTEVFEEVNSLFLDAVVFLLIPRNKQLDQLFKTAAASLTAIGNLIATWLVLFLVFGIAMTQIFGLTKFGQNETNNLNFRDIPRALIFLFRTSCGEGWNQLMEDYATMRPPYCTMTDEFFSTDCGSQSWARSLFIAWNILSMYLFVSLFVSLIYESFSYVYQRKSGLHTVDRDEIRRFKEAWAAVDPDGTGYITTEDFPRLLGELSGIFDMRIYTGEFTVQSILEQCRKRQRDTITSLPERPNPDDIDIKKMAQIINRIPVKEVQERRRRLRTFYEEVLVSVDSDKRIHFSVCFMLLAHHKLINENKSLKLDEFIRRRARLQRVEDAVQRNTVIGFFHTLHLSRRFRRITEASKAGYLTHPPQFPVPEIFVDEDEINNEDRNREARSSWTVSATLSPRSMAGEPSIPGSPSRPSLRIDTSGSVGSEDIRSPRDWFAISPSLAPGSFRDTDTGYRGAFGDTQRSTRHARDPSAVSVENVMQSLEDSAWGESIRRSFTQRRSK